ncbi:MAG: hypothetical protein ACKVE4_00850 [Dissulfuribacterales bacterium]
MKSAGVFGCLSKVLAMAVFFVVAGGGHLHLIAEAGDYLNAGQKEQIKQNMKVASVTDTAVSDALAAIEAVESEEAITESGEADEIPKIDAIDQSHVEHIPARAVEPGELDQKSDSAVKATIAETEAVAQVTNTAASKEKVEKHATKAADDIGAIIAESEAKKKIEAAAIPVPEPRVAFVPPPVAKTVQAPVEVVEKQDVAAAVAEIDIGALLAEAEDEESGEGAASGLEQFPSQVEPPDPEMMRLTAEGIKYYFGEGVAKDYKKAEELFLQAAEHDGAAAKYTLGYMYQTGQGVDKDLSKAAKWYKDAGEHDYSLPRYSYAYMLYSGQGLDENHKEAAKWYEKAADADYSQAQLCIADMYFRGQGVPRDYSKSLKWYSRAEALGNVQSQFSLGMMYFNGEGNFKKDYKKAGQWFQKAADKNFPPAQYSLGVMYESGYGFVQDQSKALTWYEKAAEAKYPKAMYRVAMMYLTGSVGKE